MHRLLLTVALAVGLATPSAAQGLKLAFHDGLVSVDANAVPLRSILTEWGKVGGTKIVGAERVSGAPLTIKLVDVSEAKALESILRSVAGYMAAPRKTGVGSSMYDRILVMPTSSAPAPASAAAARPVTPAPSNAFAGTQRFVPPARREEQAETQEEEEQDENPPNPPVFTFPQPGPNGAINVNPNGQPGTFTVNPQTGNPQGVVIQPGQPGRSTVPIGVAQPGMMVPAPAPAVQPGTPGQVIRPPGGQ